jgi:hypothetical protein
VKRGTPSKPAIASVGGRPRESIDEINLLAGSPGVDLVFKTATEQADAALRSGEPRRFG